MHTHETHLACLFISYEWKEHSKERKKGKEKKEKKINLNSTVSIFETAAAFRGRFCTLSRAQILLKKKENKLTKINYCCALYIYSEEFTQMQTKRFTEPISKGG